MSLERGDKRCFATAVDWPGWARAGRDDASALQALLDSAPRYARVVTKTLGFAAPADLSVLKVVERHGGKLRPTSAHPPPTWTEMFHR